MNEVEKSIYKELNPRAPLKCRLAQSENVLAKRLSQALGAFDWLLTAEQGHTKPSYGKEWDRDYNAVPYPEARPLDPLFYEGTGIGYLYGIIGTEQHAWQMAGWNLVRTNAEVRKRRKW